MKAKTFENLIRKVVREEIDYALRREIKTLKEDLRDELQPVITEHTERKIEVPSQNSLKEKIMGKPSRKSFKPKSFTSNDALNSLLNETAQGDTSLDSGMSPVYMDGGFSTIEGVPEESIPEAVSNAVNRDYSDLMKAMNNKTNYRP